MRWSAGAPLAVFALTAMACGDALPPLTPPTALCTSARPPAAAPACRDPLEVERRLIDPQLEMLASTDPPSGAQKVVVLTVASSAEGSRIVFRAKFRPASTDFGSSSPRKELAAHALQKLVLDPTDWVIPPAAWVCLPLDRYRAVVDPEAEPTFRGTRCAAGVLSAWIEDGRSLDQAEDDGALSREWPLDEQLFRESDSYRRSLADLNLLAHVATHGDSHWKQFVLVGQGPTARMLLVDNSMAFDGYRNRRFIDGPWDWSKLHVPSLRRETVERLRRALEPGPNGTDGLATIAQLRLERGTFTRVAPRPPTSHRDLGVRWSGPELQIGLTQAELRRLEKRARQLVARLDAGTLKTF